MHADPAAQYQTRIGLADDLECGPLSGVLAQAIADRGGAG
jgi:hypothetical protein